MLLTGLPFYVEMGEGGFLGPASLPLLERLPPGGPP